MKSTAALSALTGFILILVTNATYADKLTYRLTGEVTAIYGVSSYTPPSPFSVGDPVRMEFSVEDTVTPNFLQLGDYCTFYVYPNQTGAVTNLRLAIGDHIIERESDNAGSLMIGDECLGTGYHRDEFKFNWGFYPQPQIGTPDQQGYYWELEGVLAELLDDSGLLLSSRDLPQGNLDVTLGTPRTALTATTRTPYYNSSLGVVWSINSFGLAPESVIRNIVKEIVDINIEGGISNSYDKKLESAMQALDDNNDKNDGAAINSLYALINATEAQRGKGISREDADKLISSVNVAIKLLESQ